MSAERRAEEQGYYEQPATPPAAAPAAPTRSLSDVCARTGHRPSQTAQMTACACGEVKAPTDDRLFELGDSR